MNGEQLYAFYQRACREVSNCATEAWDELDDAARTEWNRTAEIAAHFSHDEAEAAIIHAVTGTKDLRKPAPPDCTTRCVFPGTCDCSAAKVPRHPDEHPGEDMRREHGA